MIDKTLTMNLKADTSVIQPLFDKIDKAVSKLEPQLSKRVSEAFELLLNSGDLLFEICTVEPNDSVASTSQLLVTFYPTNSFLMLARAVITGNLDSLLIK